ncbi:hypothetical protein Tco_1280262 [Tanacetum coccineum]
MASDDNDHDAEYALSKLLQMGTVEDYQRKFEMLIKRVTIHESLLKSFYISGLKLDLQCLLLRSNPSTLGEDFFKARITEARFEIIAKEDKEHIVEKKIDVILPLQDADEDSSAIDGVFNIGESNVESIEVRSKFGEFSENKASLEEVVVGGGKVLGVGEDDDLCNAATDGVLIDKGVDKEVQYDVYTVHVLIPFLKRLNDQYIKKKKMKASMQRRLWDPGIKKKN